VTINKGGKLIKASEKFYCAITGSGIDPKIGRKDVPKNFAITPDNLETSTA
jgi:hypothetical protein